MSDEVRSSSIPAPADTGSPNAESGEAPKSLDIVFSTDDDAPDSEGRMLVSIAPPSSDSDPPETLPLPPRASEPLETSPPPPPSESSPPPPSSPSAGAPSPPPSTPAPVSPAPAVISLEPTSQLRPQTSTELLPAQRHSERPPPPSQRNAAAAAQRAEASQGIKAEASSQGPMLPPASSLSSDVAPSGRASSAAPTIVTRAASMQSPPRTSSLPPGFVEPKRIIEVLGSNVPVLDSALEEEAIEDLDESEAYELSETPVPSPGSEPEIEVSIVVEDFPPLDVSVDGGDEEAAHADGASDAGSSDESSLDESSLDEGSLDGPLTGDAASGAAAADGGASPAGKRAKAPPNKRRRPPPPSARTQEKPKPEPAAAAGRKWWEEMFSEEFLRAIPILSPRQLEREVNFIDEGLGVARGGRILDLACGAGQHAVELAARGYDLVGFDLSQSQLDWAGGLAQERGQSLQFTYGDMRELAYQEAFDAVYSWNTSFGFFEEEKNIDVAHRVFNALRPGGRFLLDVINRDFVVAQQPGQTWFEGDGCVCIDDVSIDFITSRMKVKRTLMLTNGKNRECNYSLRIYGLHELGKILHDVGFKVLNVSGRPEMPGVFFGSTSPRIIILASKP